MNDTTLPTINQARSQLARLHTGNPHPDPVALRHAQQSLATAKLDRDIRQTAANVQPMLNDVQVGHLIGLLLSACGVGAESIGWLETAAREAVRNAQSGAA